MISDKIKKTLINNAIEDIYYHYKYWLNYSATARRFGVSPYAVKTIVANFKRKRRKSVTRRHLRN